MHDISSLVAIPHAFFLQDTDTVAKQLLNCVLFTICNNGTLVGGRIVETESYTHDDESSHSYKGETERCRAMFMEGGTVYVYLTYGMHHCCNIATRKAGIGDAVLLRALEPYWGLDVMRKRRMPKHSPLSSPNDNTPPDNKPPDHTPPNNKPPTQKKQSPRTIATHALCKGPGCLTKALHITKHYNQTTLHTDENLTPLHMHLMQLPEKHRVKETEIVTTTRIGIRKAVDAQQRFYIAGNACVSKPQTK